MKRFTVLLTVLIVVAAIAYGVGMARQEAVYQAFISQGDAALAAGDNFTAIEAFTSAISHNDDSMAAHLKRGEAYRRRHELDAAMRDLRRAAELDPLAPHPREILGDVNYSMGRYAAAVDRYREYLRLEDRSPRVLYKLALTMVKLGQVSQAVTELNRALNIDERFAEAHYLLGICLREVQRPADSLASLERAVALNPALLQAREELASAYGRLERYQEQNRQLEVLAALDAGGRREVALALGYARDGAVERAVVRLGNATRQFPDDPQTYIALGRLWLERAEHGGRVELSKALGALEGVIGSDSTSEAHVLYGRALMLAGELGRAERSFEQATAHYPVEPLAFYYLFDVADRRGHLAAAQRALVDYAALAGMDAPRLDARLLARLADAYLKNGDTVSARQALDRAQRLDPSHPGVRALALKLARD